MSSSPPLVFVTNISSNPVTFDTITLAAGGKIQTALTPKIKSLQRQNLVYYNTLDFQQPEGTRISVATAETVTITDNEVTITCNNGSAIAFTLPNSMPANFECDVVQLGAGAVGFTAASGATLVSRGTLTHTNGAGAKVHAEVLTNVDGVSAAWLLSGDRV